MWEMEDAEFAAVYRCLPKLVLALRLAMAADAVNILSLNGAAGGQTVFHLHFHLIPVHDGQPVLRRKGRRVAFQFVQRPASRKELLQVAEEIRAHLPGRRRAARGAKRAR
jgi:diadenosine tetraphosphate (Ap4A) HIT family hydrolase